MSVSLMRRHAAAPVRAPRPGASARVGLWLALPMVLAAVVQGQVWVAMSIVLVAWSTARLVEAQEIGGVGVSLMHTREHAERACARGQFAIARSLYERALVLAGAAARHDESVIRDRYNLAAVQAMLGDFDAAGRDLEGLLDCLERIDLAWLEHSTWLLRYVAYHLAAQGAGQGRARRARRLARAALRLIESAEDAPGLDRSVATREVGWTLLTLGELELAERTFRRALQLAAEEPGSGVEADDDEAPPWSPYRAASVSGPRPGTAVDDPNLGLALTLLARGRPHEARGLLTSQRALVLQDRLPPEMAGKVLRGLGEAHLMLGRLDEAAANLAEALRLDEQGDLATGGASLDLIALSDVARLQDDLDRAESFLGDARSRMTRRVAQGPVGVLFHERRARLALAQRRPATALAASDRAIGIGARVLDVDHPRVVPVLLTHARVEIGRGHPEVADRLLAQANNLLERRLGDRHPLQAEWLEARAELDLQRGHARAARLSLERALALREAEGWGGAPARERLRAHLGALPGEGRAGDPAPSVP